MGKREIIEHWRKMAERDWASATLLLKGKQYIHALFFAHLVVEKLLKAHWVKDNEEINPPRTHDLEHLYSQTELKISTDNLDLIRVMNSWNLEGRYQDYKDKFYKETSGEYTREKLNQVKELKKWLQSELQKRK